MKTAFFEYHRPSDEQFEHIWRNCAFSFDANVLLDLYRYSESSRDELLKMMQMYRSRIWVPYQVALEFHKNRISVISNSHSRAEKITKSLKALISQLEGERQHPYITTEIANSISAQLSGNVASIDEAQRSYPDLLLNDKIGQQLLELLDGRVGQKYPPEDLDKLRISIETRYDNKVPPGYVDRKDKDQLGSHGDCIVWFQLMDYAKTHKRPVIFVTRDTKEDWWVEFAGKTLQPRPELRREFFESTGQQFYLYQASQFIQYANKNSKTELSSRLLDETKVISRDADFEVSGRSHVNESSPATGDNRQYNRTRLHLRRALQQAKIKPDSQELRNRIDSLNEQLTDLTNLNSAAPSDALEELIFGVQTRIEHARTSLILSRLESGDFGLISNIGTHTDNDFSLDGNEAGGPHLPKE